MWTILPPPELATSMDGLQRALADIKLVADARTAELQVTNNHAISLMDQLTQAKLAVDGYVAKLADADSKRSEAEQTRDETEQVFTRVVSNLVAASDRTELKLTVIHAELADTKSKLADTENKLAASEHAKAQMKQALDESERSCGEQVAALQKELFAAQQALEITKLELESSKNEHWDAWSELVGVKLERSHLEDDVAQADQIINTLKQQLAKKNLELNEKLQAANTSERSHNHTKTLLGSVIKRGDVLKQELADTKTSLAETQNQLEEANENAKPTKTRLEETTKVLTKTKQRLKDVELTLRNTTKNLNTTQQDLADAKLMLKDARENLTQNARDHMDLSQALQKDRDRLRTAWNDAYNENLRLAEATNKQPLEACKWLSGSKYCTCSRCTDYRARKELAIRARTPSPTPSFEIDSDTESEMIKQITAADTRAYYAEYHAGFLQQMIDGIYAGNVHMLSVLRQLTDLQKELQNIAHRNHELESKRAEMDEAVKEMNACFPVSIFDHDERKKFPAGVDEQFSVELLLRKIEALAKREAEREYETDSDDDIEVIIDFPEPKTMIARTE